MMSSLPSTYFIEESVFLAKDFYLLLEKLISSGNVHFVVDSNLMNSVNNLKKLGKLDDAYLIEGLYSYLKGNGLVDEVDTLGYFVVDDLLKYFEDIKGEKICIVQKESIYETFKTLKNHNVKFLKIHDGNLEEWIEEAVEETEAFYVKNDIYINKIDTDGLKFVYSPKFGYLKLDRNDQKSGGEGTCYPTYKNLYCKIYNKKHITYVNYKKLQRMLEMQVFNPFIVWPQDLLYYNDDFVGYVMKQVKGAKSLTELKDDGFVKYQSFADRTKICINILKNIDYLHKKGILIGDLKDDNILVKNPNEIYIIDCGSFQIDDYGCDVFTRGWTDKNYKKDDLNKNLRHLNDEYYPINKLIFEILILKNPHYSKNNTEIDYEDNKTFEFPLEINEDTQKMGKYIIPWMIMTQRVREFFYYYFNDSKNRRITYIKDRINELVIMLKMFEEYNY